jgi:hypothetical protein
VEALEGMEHVAEVVGFDASEWDDDPPSEADVADCWRRGILWWKLDAHQQDVYHRFRAWEAARVAPGYAENIDAIGAEFDDVFAHEAGRRVGKTFLWIVVALENAIQRDGAIITCATAFQKDIGEIIVPIVNVIARDAPDDMRPRYRGSQEEKHAGIYLPKNGSVIKLVGVDRHPDGLRGRFSDGMFFSEAGFIKRLDDLLRSVVLSQFQRRPWACCVLESSTPKMPDHDFSRVFVPDAKLRGAYVMQTLDANKAISLKEKEKAIRQAGGRGHPTCEREYYCEATRDPEVMVVPEFDERLHVVASQTPKHALAYTAADPGQADMFALVFAHYDFARAKLVVSRSWARRGTTTRQVAAVTAHYEHLLWGRWPDEKLAALPVRRVADADGWRELLRGIDGVDDARCEELHRMANTAGKERPPLAWRGKRPPDGVLTAWDGREFQQAPSERRTDVDLRLIQDLRSEYGIAFQNTAKDNAAAQLNALRDAIGAGLIEFSPAAGPVIEHVKGAIWNAKRTGYERSTVHGHYDALAALVYLWRNVRRDQNPVAPAHALLGDDEFASTRSQHLTKEGAAVRALLGDVVRGNGRRVAPRKTHGRRH